MHGLHVQKSYHLIWNLKIMIWSLITRTDRSLDVGNNKVFACGSQSWSLCLRLRNILKRGLTDSNDSNSNNSKFWFKCSQTWVGSFSCNGIHIRYVTYVRTVYTILYTVYCLLYYILYADKPLQTQICTRQRDSHSLIISWTRFHRRPAIPVLSRWTQTGECIRFYMPGSQRFCNETRTGAVGFAMCL